MNIPDVIKIGDTEFSVKDTPALLELIQTARKEEKDKLYAQIQSLESAKRVLEDEKKISGKLTAEKEEQLVALKTELDTAKGDKVKLEAELKEFETGKGKGKKEEEMKEMLTKDEVKAMVAEMLKETAKEVSGKVEEVKKDLTTKEVADFRKELLEKNKGLLIEKLVPENLDTKEAVTKAVDEALAESKNYIIKEYEVGGKKQKMTLAEYEAFEQEAKEKEEAEKAARTQHYTPGAQYPAPPAGFSGDLTDKDLLSKLDGMSDAEYAKHADEILREARSLKYIPEEQ